MVIGRATRAAWQPQRALAEPIVVAIDLPAGELPLDIDRDSVSKRSLAEIALQQERLLRVKLLHGGDHLVQLGLHGRLRLDKSAMSFIARWLLV